MRSDTFYSFALLFLIVDLILKVCGSVILHRHFIFKNIFGTRITLTFLFGRELLFTKFVIKLTQL